MKLQVGVKAILKNSKGLYLLIQRSKPLDGDIKWDIPGGRIGRFDPSERLEDALNRELREEIGAEPEGPIRLIMAQDIIPPDANLHVVRLTYTARFNKDVILSEEHQDFRWVTKEEALRLNIDPYLRKPLETL
ncbi:MAG TPA: NUDIX hydrolase [Candidatus Saccharimonadales bacterium]|jgi:8-oxo-dGTP pyrophosphatase MutT (NUDIX family)